VFEQFRSITEKDRAMFYLIAIPRPSFTKSCALQVFRVVRSAMSSAAAAGEAAQIARKEIADAWAESGRQQP
jgi:hypothetical protein